jgi:hypothetical protein
MGERLVQNCFLSCELRHPGLPDEGINVAYSEKGGSDAQLRFVDIAAVRTGLREEVVCIRCLARVIRSCSRGGVQ